MRRAFFAGLNRKKIPVLLGFVVLSVFAIAQDLPAGKPDSKSLAYEAIND